MAASTDPEKDAAVLEIVPAHHDVETQRRPSSIHSDTTTDAHSGHEEHGMKEKSGQEEDVIHHDALIPTMTLGGGRGGPAGADADVERGSRRSRSRASSARSRALTIIPRSQRRGLFSRFAVVPEVERPYDYRSSTKWGITLTIALAATAAPLGSSIFYPALLAITKDLHTGETITNLSVALYMISMSIFPLWWSSFSEQFGRRTIYLISFFLLVVFASLSAISTNITMLIVFRMGSGGASASVQAVGAGTIADIWESRERGRAMGIFYLGPLLGPLIAPILGGALAEGLGWRATMWFVAIYGLVIFVMVLFFLPETLARRKADETPAAAAATEELRRMTTTESAKVRTRRFAAVLKRFFIDPLSVLLFLRFPPVLITVFLSAIAYGALFVQNIATQQKFSGPPYNYNELIVGLLYLPSGLGYFSASLLGGPWIDRIMAREAKKANRYDEKGRLVFLPEDRMRENMWVANTMYPLGLLIYAWTLNYGVMWVVPSIGGFIFGLSSMLVFAAATTMLTEFVRTKSSAGVAVNNFVRNIFSCVGAIVASPWINAVGVGWVFTTLSLFCMVAGFLAIWTLRRNAPRWRKDMDEALKKMK